MAQQRPQGRMGENKAMITMTFEKDGKAEAVVKTDDWLASHELQSRDSWAWTLVSWSASEGASTYWVEKWLAEQEFIAEALAPYRKEET